MLLFFVVLCCYTYIYNSHLYSNLPLYSFLCNPPYRFPILEHEKAWVDPRHGSKFVLEDLRPIPEHNDDNDKEDSLLLKNKKEVSECRYCSRRMLSSILIQHETSCLDARTNERRIRYGRKIEVKGAQAMDCCILPQRPRNFRIGKVTHDSIELLWEPPVFDGGTFISDYIIAMVSGNLWSCQCYKYVG